MGREIARILRLPAGEMKDHEGKEFAEDWVIADLGKDDDEALIFLTTRSVHASEYMSMIPGNQLELGVLLARLINERFAAGTPGEWSALLAECLEEAEALKAKHGEAREERDKAAGQLDLSGMALKRKRP